MHASYNIHLSLPSLNTNTDVNNTTRMRDPHHTTIPTRLPADDCPGDAHGRSERHGERHRNRAVRLLH